jgi:ribonuclease HII
VVRKKEEEKGKTNKVLFSLRTQLYEKPFWDKNQVVAGLDEAGRGPLAGPVVVGCVVFPPNTELFLKTDSKGYSQKQRDFLFRKILKKALYVGVSFATPEEIEKYNIYRATQRVFLKAVQNIPFKITAVFTDYMLLQGLDIPVYALPKGDKKVFSIAAASIVAKVVRDRIMELYGKIYPQYGFEKHKGYPTKEHLENLKKYGICEIHRKNYKPVKELLKD